jgi:Leucine-rich repeat (LRR) protein
LRQRAGFALLVVVLAASARAAIPQSEHDALVAFYNATSGAAWTKSTNWLGAAGTECTWFGISCDAQQAHVTGIVMLNNNVAGTLPTELSALPSLQNIILEHNQLSGAIPQSLGSIKTLATLNLINNRLTGTIPVTLLTDTNLTFVRVSLNDLDGNDFLAGIGALTKLTTLDLGDCKLRGAIPTASLLKMKNLLGLYLSRNQMTGPLPPELATLPLVTLTIDRNQFSGTIAPAFGQLPNLTIFNVTANRFSGSLPSFAATKLQQLNVSINEFSGPLPADLPPSVTDVVIARNRFSGPIPPQLASLPNLKTFIAYTNELSGTIPAQFAQPQNFTNLNVSYNLLGGALPSELASSPKLQTLEIVANAFRGEFPSAFTQSAIKSLHIEHNALFANNPATKAWLDANASTGPGWPNTQTVAPSNVAFTGTTAFSATLTWTPIAFTGGPGGYQVLVSTTPGGPYVPQTLTANKAQSSVIVPGLQPSTTYFAIVKTITFANGAQPNTLFSDPTPELSFTTAPLTATAAQLIASVLPAPIAEPPNTAGGTATYRITNIGGTPAAVSITQSGNFFTQSPSSFTLEAGASQSITITALAEPEAVYEGSATASTTGSTVTVPVRLVVAAGTSSASIDVSAYRLDLVSSSGQNATGTFSVTNRGTSPFTGTLSADVEWIAPPAGLLRLAPGETQNVSITVNPSKRPDPSLLTGTVTGTVQILALSNRLSKRGFYDGSSSSTAATISVSLTTVVLPGASSIPPLGADEVVWFAPGVGHVVGSVGLFLSDISILNAFGSRAIDDVKLYFKPTIATNPLLASLGSVPVAQSVVIGDVVKNVFGGDGQVGSMQVRSKQWQTLAISANVLNISNPLGTYGTSIPIFRSDRAAGPAERIFLTGLRRTDTSHTNLFLQETTGHAAAATIDFFDENGNVIATREEPVDPFALKPVNNVVPAGGVMARITSHDASHLHAYATPVDEASGDNWSVVDWARQYGFDPSEPVVIAVAGAVAGANETYFRTDATITNIECLSEEQRANGLCGATDVTLTYRTNGGEVIEKTIALEPFHTTQLDDVVSTLFNAPGTVGYITVRPAHGNLAVASRTYTTQKNSAATYGSAVATLAVSSALRPGQFRALGGIDDANTASIVARSPATYRNNVGLVEVRGEPAKVRMTLSYLDAKTRVTAAVVATREFDLTPNQSLQIPLTSILGPAREELGLLRNLRVQFDVISSTGGVLLYISSVDNGTGDSIIRTD